MSGAVEALLSTASAQECLIELSDWSALVAVQLGPTSFVQTGVWESPAIRQLGVGLPRRCQGLGLGVQPRSPNARRGGAMCQASH